MRAVDGVSFAVEAGETVGIIGPNGAGKTTVLGPISGFVSADAGRVRLGATDISGLRPGARGRLGVVRSFQDAALFPTLTVLDTVRVAQERFHPTRVLLSTLGRPRVERRREERARELIALFGLEALADRRIVELSTGTRRLTELACALALAPRVLLLDEPSAGIAQREAEALAELLVRVKTALGATLVVVEHDLPFISAIADRLVAMDSGRVICAGTPAHVKADQHVADSYLGIEPIAIARSAPSPVPIPPPAPGRRA